MTNFLEQINSPDDLKKLSVDELNALAGEMREFILDSVSKTGGHLASSLGVVELTLAMHCVFDFKKDKLLWDVGHQCYAHKIITGRKDAFARLRQSGGISGFPNPDESAYDQFVVGHAGTSIATAIGMALGEELKTENEKLKSEDQERDTQYAIRHTNKIVALIGDASIVNGVSFEALNNLGLVERQLLIVLNDNSMAIDPTAGALAKYFSKVRLSHTYEDLRRTTKNILEHLPVIGKSVEEAVEKIKKGIRMALPTSQMFESLNIPYFGPVDGHDISSLIKLFTALAQLDSPVVLHVYTKKGKGFSPAEQDRPKFHSTGPFKMNGDLVEPDSVAARRSFTDVFGEHLTHLAEKDKRIVAITSAMCDGTGLGEFRSRFADRFYDVGIAESAAVDIAAGLARSGLKPVVCIYSTFLQRSFDQIFQEVALQNLPVVFCIDRSGVVGSDGPTHHGLMDIGFLRMMPNIVLVAPADEVELKLALEFALSENRPVALRYPKDVVPSDDFDRTACTESFKLGKSVVVRQGMDSAVVIVTYGSVLTEALKAAQMLAEDGIEIDVINARFAAPIDEEIISLLGQGKGIITVEDHRLACGFGSGLLESAAAYSSRILRDAYRAKQKRNMQSWPQAKRRHDIRNTGIVTLGMPKEFIKHDSRSAQLMEASVNADEIARTVKEMLKA